MNKKIRLNLLALLALTVGSAVYGLSWEPYENLEPLEPLTRGGNQLALVTVKAETGETLALYSQDVELGWTSGYNGLGPMAVNVESELDIKVGRNQGSAYYFGPEDFENLTPLGEIAIRPGRPQPYGTKLPEGVQTSVRLLTLAEGVDWVQQIEDRVRRHLDDPERADALAHQLFDLRSYGDIESAKMVGYYTFPTTEGLYLELYCTHVLVGSRGATPNARRVQAIIGRDSVEVMASHGSTLHRPDGIPLETHDYNRGYWGVDDDEHKPQGKILSKTFL